MSAAVSLRPVPESEGITPRGWHTLRILPKIRKLVARRVFNTADRSDVEQQLMLHALKAETTYREGEGDFWAYFSRFVRGRLYRELRGIHACGMRSKGGEPPPVGEEPGRMPVPIRIGELGPEAFGALIVADADAVLDFAHAEHFLATLKPIPRAVVDMVVDGMSYADIGGMLQLSRERVRQIHLGVIRKRKAWQQ